MLREEPSFERFELPFYVSPSREITMAIAPLIRFQGDTMASAFAKLLDDWEESLSAVNSNLVDLFLARVVYFDFAVINLQPYVRFTRNWDRPLYVPLYTAAQNVDTRLPEPVRKFLCRFVGTTHDCLIISGFSRLWRYVKDIIEESDVPPGSYDYWKDAVSVYKTSYGSSLFLNSDLACGWHCFELHKLRLVGDFPNFVYDFFDLALSEREVREWFYKDLF